MKVTKYLTFFAKNEPEKQNFLKLLACEQIFWKSSTWLILALIPLAVSNSDEIATMKEVSIRFSSNYLPQSHGHNHQSLLRDAMLWNCSQEN